MSNSNMTLFLRDCEAGIEYKINIPGITTVGRGGNSDIQPDSMSVSKTHAAISVVLDYGVLKEIWIEDFNSRNGTFVGQPGEWEKVRGRKQLQLNDAIKFGNAAKYYILTPTPLNLPCDEDHRSPKVNVGAGEMVKEIISPSNGTPFHAVPGTESYSLQPPASSAPHQPPVVRSVANNAELQPSPSMNQMSQNYPAHSPHAQSQSTSLLPQPHAPPPQPLQQSGFLPPAQTLHRMPHQQQLPIRKLDTTFEAQMLMANTTSSQGNTGRYNNGASGSYSNTFQQARAPQQLGQIGGVPMYPDPNNFKRVTTDMYNDNLPPYASPVNNLLPPPSSWLGGLHMTSSQQPPIHPDNQKVRSPPLQDYKIDNDTAESLGAADFSSFLKAKIQELGATSTAMPRFDPSTLKSRPITDAVAEILYVSTTAEDGPPSAMPNLKGNGSMRSGASVRQLGALDGENDIDGPPIDLSKGAVVSTENAKGKKQVNAPQSPPKGQGISEKKAYSPQGVSEAVIHEGLAESILEQEQSTVATLTLVTAELKNLYDKLLLGAHNAQSGVVENALGSTDLEANGEIAAGLRSIVSFMLTDNVKRMKQLCQSSLLQIMQADYQDKLNAASASGKAVDPASPTKAVYDTVVRVTGQLESLLAFVNRNINGSDAVGAGFQQGLSPEEINEVSLHVLGEIILTLNNILQQAAHVMQTVDQLSQAVELNASLDSHFSHQNVSGSMQKLLSSLNSDGAGAGSSRRFDSVVSDMRKKKVVSDGLPSLAEHLASFEADVTGGSGVGAAAADVDGMGSPGSPSVLLRRSPRAKNKKEKEDLMRGVLNMVLDAGLRVVRTAFRHWLRTCIEDARNEAKAAASKDTVKRVVRMFAVRSLRDVNAAFRTWRDITIASRQTSSAGNEMARLKMKLMDITNRLYEITSHDDTAAALLAEKSFNRELSLVNIELRNNVHELQTKLVELIPSKKSTVGGGSGGAQRVAMVQDVLVAREDEIVKLRRDYSSLMDQVKQYEQFYEVDLNKAKTRSRSKSRSPGRRGRSTSASGNSDGEKDDVRGRSNRNVSKVGGGRRGGGKDKKHSALRALAVRDIDRLVGDMNSKIARQVLLLEMQRLSGALQATQNESNDLKAKVAKEKSKRIQLSQAHHILCDRLTVVENNQHILLESLTNVVGPDGAAKVLEAAYKQGFNRHDASEGVNNDMEMAPDGTELKLVENDPDDADGAASVNKKELKKPPRRMVSIATQD